MTEGFHRRPLPADLIDFSSPEGRRLLADAIEDGTAGAFFPLIAQLHTQQEPAWCGLGTLVTVLNALDVDPGRTWKGPWRWFGEDLLQCCAAVETAQTKGLTLVEVGCLARCNGAAVEVHHATLDGEAAFREALVASVRAPAGPFLVAAYDRQGLGQTGTGHYSPLGAWHAASDRVLILDVARFKYPPHWAPTSQLYAAMLQEDPVSGMPRGWLHLSRAAELGPPGEDALTLARRVGAPLPGCSHPGVPSCSPQGTE